MSLKNGIEKLSKTMDELGLSEITVEQSFLFGIWKKEIHLSKTTKSNPTPVSTVINTPIVSTNTENVSNISSAETIKSPMVGVVYLAPEPGAKPFVQIGNSIKAGDTICLIEAMKTFNPVKADRSGIVKQILVKDSDIVEFDTPLIIVE